MLLCCVQPCCSGVEKFVIPMAWHASDVVVMICRNTSAHQLILQKNEQIYKLLAIAVSMCPSTTRWLEENVRDQLHFKCSSELFEMQSSNIDAFKKAFGQGCPKFVTAAPPDLSEVGADNHLVGYHEALRLFVQEVRGVASSLETDNCFTCSADVFQQAYVHLSLDCGYYFFFSFVFVILQTNLCV